MIVRTKDPRGQTAYLADPSVKKRIELVGYKNGHEETDEQILMSSVFEFGDTKVREVMVSVFHIVGTRSELANEYRDKLASALY